MEMWGGARPVIASYLANKFAAELHFITIVQNPGSRRTYDDLNPLDFSGK